jgi:hypothetical protein
MPSLRVLSLTSCWKKLFSYEPKQPYLGLVSEVNF